MRPLALTLLLLLAADSRAQESTPFVSGYVVAGGDTLRGEVALGTEAQNTRGVRFRPSPQAEAVLYRPAEAEAFGADAGRDYRRRLFQLRAVREADPATPNDRLGFARVVRSGPASLLALETSPGRVTYYVETDGQPIGLYLVQDEVMTGEGRRLRERPLYRQTLLALLGACGPAGLDRLAYTEPALAGAVDAYSTCKDPTFVAEAAAPARRRPTRATVEFGVAYAAGSFRRAVARPSATPDPGVGALRLRAGLEVAPALLPPAIRVVVGAEYDHGVVDLARGGRYSDRVSTVHGALGLRMTMPAGPSRLYLGAGVLSGTALAQRSQAEAERVPGDGSTWNTAPDDFRSSGGEYAELGIEPVGLPILFTVRAQTTVFGSGPVFIPLAQSASYGTRTVAVGLTARF